MPWAMPSIETSISVDDTTLISVTSWSLMEAQLALTAPSFSFIAGIINVRLGQDHLSVITPYKQTEGGNMSWTLIIQQRSL